MRITFVLVFFFLSSLMLIPKETLSSDSDNSQPKEGLWILGASYGFPGGFNITGGYFGSKLGTRISFGITPNKGAGIQALVEFPNNSDIDVFFSPAFAIGYLNNLNYYGPNGYTGLGLDTHIYGFTTFLGISLPIISNGSDFLFDIGYSYAWD